ncbi:uncharacterized protein ACBT57_008049 isoform 2-T3 [Dama dama]
MAHDYGTANVDQGTQPADLFLCEREPEKPESSKQSFCTDRAREKMELHFEVLRSSTTTEDNTLRRSSSAPLISGFGYQDQGPKSSSCLVWSTTFSNFTPSLTHTIEEIVYSPPSPPDL